MSAPARLSIEGVTVAFGDVSALSGVSLEVPAGDFLGLLGPNGSGKTTLLRVISRALAPQLGEVKLDGEDLRRYAPAELARRMAVVPQISVPTLDFTAGELVRMGRSPYQGRWGVETRLDREVAEEAMRLTSTLPFEGRVAGTLSGGEYQRVLVARALAQEPDLLLLDEPTAHLDLSAQIGLLELLHRLNRLQGITVVAVLHDLNLAATYCRRLAMLHRGRLVSLGSPEEVLTVERLREVYDAETLVRPHPLTGRPMVVPVPGSEGAFPEGPRPRVHLICGGGTGAGLLRALHVRGYPLTAGVLNAGDTDHAAARELGIPVAEAPPFSAFPPESMEAAGAMMEAAEVIVLTDTPFGPGNLPNLLALSKAQREGKRVLIVVPDPKRDWDFTDGAAAALRSAVESAGAERVANAAEALAALVPHRPV
ncbi:MAG: ABC transporter ATP-binding protein [Armatimonadetes bacterium]|nr:ABC transporter ATP-binding protein [Armatimonadota bacterium]